MKKKNTKDKSNEKNGNEEEKEIKQEKNISNSKLKSSKGDKKRKADNEDINDSTKKKKREDKEVKNEKDKSNETKKDKTNKSNEESKKNDEENEKEENSEDEESNARYNLDLYDKKAVYGDLDVIELRNKRKVTVPSVKRRNLLKTYDIDEKNEKILKKAIKKFIHAEEQRMLELKKKYGNSNKILRIEMKDVIAHVIGQYPLADTRSTHKVLIGLTKEIVNKSKSNIELVGDTLNDVKELKSIVAID